MKIAKTFIRNFQFDFVLNNITNISNMKKKEFWFSTELSVNLTLSFNWRRTQYVEPNLLFVALPLTADVTNGRTDRHNSGALGILLVLNTSTLSSGLTFETILRFQEISSICKPYNNINRIFVTDFASATFYFNKFLKPQDRLEGQSRT